MRTAVTTPELIQRNLQRLVTESVMNAQALAVVSNISHATLVRKLAQNDCQFTVLEVASITRALGLKFEAVFEDHPDMRPCPTELCIESAHEWVRGEQFHLCRIEPIEDDENGFRVHGHLQVETGQWVAWVDPYDLPDGPEGASAAWILADAFEQMQKRCEDLNFEEGDDRGDRSA